MQSQTLSPHVNHQQNLIDHSSPKYKDAYDRYAESLHRQGTYNVYPETTSNSNNTHTQQAHVVSVIKDAHAKLATMSSKHSSILTSQTMAEPHKLNIYQDMNQDNNNKRGASARQEGARIDKNEAAKGVEERNHQVILTVKE